MYLVFKHFGLEFFQILAVLAAITEVIKENEGKETETEYFAALVRFGFNLRRNYLK